MKRRITPILMAVLAAMLVASAAANDGKPRAVPLEPIKEFDVVAKGEVVKHTFEIRNEGDAPLEVTDVRPSCGCTVARYDRTIAPGEIGKVHVTLKTDNFAGPISKSIAVFTNDFDNPKLQLVVKAHVKPYIQVSPGYARYNYVRGEEIVPIGQVLWAEDGSDIKILKAKGPFEHVTVNYREATEKERDPRGTGRQWRLDIELSPDSPVGPLRNHVLVTIDHPKQKTVKIPVSGFIRPRQHVTPDEMNFGQLQGASLPSRRTLSFTNFITKPIELTEIETEFEAIKAEVRPSANETEKGYRFKLVLTIGPGMPKGNFDSTVKIHTTDPQNPVIEVPIKGTVL
ncbi:MAG: DUF1573 domain-containing protein [Thermoanaerobaculia bacterium]